MHFIFEVVPEGHLEVCRSRGEPLEGRGGEGVADGSDALIGNHELGAVRAVVEPEAEVDLRVVGEDGGRDGLGHAGEGGVAEGDGVEAHVDVDGDAGGDDDAVGEKGAK